MFTAIVGVSRSFCDWFAALESPGTNGTVLPLCAGSPQLNSSVLFQATKHHSSLSAVIYFSESIQ